MTNMPVMPVKGSHHDDNPRLPSAQFAIARFGNSIYQNVATKIFVNPNFARAKPHINRNFTQIPNKSDIHINPHFNHSAYLKKYSAANKMVVDSVVKESVKSTGIHINPKLLQIASEQLTKLAESTTEKINKLSEPIKAENPYIIRTKSKIVKNNAKVTPLPPENKPINLSRSKFKFVKLNTNVVNNRKISDNPLSFKAIKQMTNKFPPSASVAKSKYHFIRRSLNKPSLIRQCSTSSLTKSRYRFVSKSVNMSTLSRHDILNNSVLRLRKLQPNKHFINKQSKNKVWKKTDDCSAVSSSRFKLQKHAVNVVNSSNLPSNRSVLKLNLKHRNEIVFIKGQKYIKSNKTLRKIAIEKTTPRQSKRTIQQVVSIGGVTYVQKNENVFVVDNRKLNHRRKLKKTNIPCSTYRRFGVCKRQQSGKCSLLHDFKQVMICQRFLKGTCKIEGCRLSHDVSLEKMPTCKYFLEGCCVRDECPYLHVKLSKTASICIDFLKGYCGKGKDCDKKHVDKCPNIHKSGKCKNAKCPYPHGKAPLLNSNNTKLVSKCLKVKLKNKDKCKQTETIPRPKALNVASNSEQELSRYFEESENIVSQLKAKGVSSDDIQTYNYVKRPQLGDLPAFISLN